MDDGDGIAFGCYTPLFRFRSPRILQAVGGYRECDNVVFYENLS